MSEYQRYNAVHSLSKMSRKIVHKYSNNPTNKTKDSKPQRQRRKTSENNDRQGHVAVRMRGLESGKNLCRSTLKGPNRPLHQFPRSFPAASP